MDSTGTLNGSLVNALPLNAGWFTLRATATADIPVTTSVKAIRRARLIGTAPVTTPVTQCNAIRRRPSSGEVKTSVPFAAQFRRRANGQGALAVSVVCYATVNARLTTFGACLVSIDGVASLFWKYRMPAPLKRIARVPETLSRVVLPQEARRLSAPAGSTAAQVSPLKNEARVAATRREASADPDRWRVE